METAKTQNATLKIGGMTCINCQIKIEKQLLKIDGIVKVKVDWEKSIAEMEFNKDLVSLEKIISEIEILGYKVLKSDKKQKDFITVIFYITVIIVLFVILQKTGVMNLLVPSSIASSKMSYALLFVTGLLTSVHCIAMCGGINLSQSLSGGKKSLSGFKIIKSPILYNLGRVLSYTMIGLVLGIVGYLVSGAASAGGELSIPFNVQGILKIIAGIFMLFAGISLLGILPFLRKFAPHLPAIISKKINSVQAKKSAPFFVGLLNGFMPCGPLQAMWIVALATANPFYGAFSMFAFSMGTIPLMLGLGSLVSFLGKRNTEVVMKVGAVLVIVMALSMVSQGFALGGFYSQNLVKENISNIVMNNGKQIVKSTLNPFRYPEITVKKGIPVHWEITASKSALNGCNYRMIFQDFGFAYEMNYGTNVIEFTPEKAGNFQYTCWMGMVRGKIKVEE